MPTTHSWKPTNSGYILDAANYADGTAFAAGDTLLVNGGIPNAMGLNGTIAPLTTGNYQFNPTAASTGVYFINMQLNAASTLSVVGPQVLAWKDQGQFINDGAFQIGSAAAPGSVLFSMYDLYASIPAALTNTGSVVLQNNSRFRTSIVLDDNDVFLNAAGVDAERQ